MREPLSLGPFMTLLFISETRLLRFWFAFASLGWVAWILGDASFAVTHETSAQYASPPTYALGFAINGFALLYGSITNHYNRWLLFAEGILGVSVWGAMAYSDAIDQTVIGPATVGALIAFFILCRYPTHYTVPGTDDGYRVDS